MRRPATTWLLDDGTPSSNAVRLHWLYTWLRPGVPHIGRSGDKRVEIAQQQLVIGVS